MWRHIQRFENFLVILLLALLAVVLLFALAGLVREIAHKILSAPFLLIGVGELLDIFGFFLLILIGVELMETIKAYLAEHAVRVEVVLLASIIAVARKVIILDPKRLSGLTLIGVGVLVITLAAGYLPIKRAHRNHA